MKHRPGTQGPFRLSAEARPGSGTKESGALSRARGRVIAVDLGPTGSPGRAFRSTEGGSRAMAARAGRVESIKSESVRGLRSVRGAVREPRRPAAQALGNAGMLAAAVNGLRKTTTLRMLQGCHGTASEEGGVCARRGRRVDTSCGVADTHSQPHPATGCSSPNLLQTPSSTPAMSMTRLCSTTSPRSRRSMQVRARRRRSERDALRCCAD